MKRSNSYNKRFSEDIRDPEFAQEYILGHLNSDDEPLELEEVLKIIIRKMGTTDFAEFVGDTKGNIDNFLSGRRNPKRETLDKFLKPFGLKTSLGAAKIESEVA